MRSIFIVGDLKYTFVAQQLGLSDRSV